MRRLDDISSGLVLAVALTVYWITADTGVSYWDCPEYVTVASRLEVGHPPGNPIWELCMRVLTSPFPESSHAVVVNMASGLFMALAALFLSRIIFMMVSETVFPSDTMLSATKEGKWQSVAAAAVSFGGGLCFAFCDSAWFSAVEAEVYAMSAFLTSFSLWLMMVWRRSAQSPRGDRLLILIAYLMGLSLGVHQLNLLILPALSLIAVFRLYHGKRVVLAACVGVAASFAAVGFVLLVMMPGSLRAAGALELFAVNKLGCPVHTGTVLYSFLAIVLFAAVVFTIIRSPRFFEVLKLKQRYLLLPLWCLFFLWLGFMSFAIILIRGAAMPPMNEGTPADIFALQRYIAREQYGSTPLVYGPTPFSKPLLAEDFPNGDSLPRYSRYALVKVKPEYVPFRQEARLCNRSGFAGGSDSLENAVASGGYLLADWSFKRRTAPELDMWFPRITSGLPSHMDSYADWAGMEVGNMVEVEASAVVDSAGHAEGKIGFDGIRRKVKSFRPTYWQNLRYFITYQAGYMYFRYLMWNFAGRQNDIPSTGEIDHGNFITGIPIVDRAMLGPLGELPAEAWEGNTGHNDYHSLPLLFGIAGILLLLRCGRAGKRTLAVIVLFFLMTGLAITVYLNQTPGEPRERDYAFIGSYMAFSIWIAFGMVWIAYSVFKHTENSLLRLVSLLPAFAMPVLMGWVNFDDHDRRGRYETASFARSVLDATPSGIILTQGDNFTFPLWYVTETEGNSNKHVVVDVSYLALPGYVVNLMHQGRDMISFTATPADIAYGAYAFTKIAHDADTVTVSLKEALEELYSQKRGIPLLRHSRVFLPGLRDSIPMELDLRKVAPGGSIPFRTLMILDIMASNSRPVHFLTSLPASLTSPFAGNLIELPYSDSYIPGTDSAGYVSLLGNASAAMARESGRSFRPRYIEPVVADQHVRQRGAFARIARKQLEVGNAEGAEATLLCALSNLPYDEVPPGSFTVGDSTFHEGRETASLLSSLAVIHKNKSLEETADSIRHIINARSEAWMRYYKALPSSRRHAVSDRTRRIIIEGDSSVKIRSAKCKH